MKRLTCVLAMALGVVALATIPVLADNEVGMVTGAIAGLQNGHTFAPTPDGKPAPVYREADLRWDSKEARDKGMATAGFKAVAGDIPNFATGGVTVLLGQKTN